MKKGLFALLLLFGIVLCVLPGCNYTTQTVTPTLPVLSSSETEAISSGCEMLDGTWTVGGIYYNRWTINSGQTKLSNILKTWKWGQHLN